MPRQTSTKSKVKEGKTVTKKRESPSSKKTMEKSISKASRDPKKSKQGKTAKRREGLITDRTKLGSAIQQEELQNKQFIGQLVDQPEGRPLANVMVHGFFLTDGEEERNLRYDVTNMRGIFILSYPIPSILRSHEARVGKPHPRLRLHVKDREGREIHEVEVNIQPEQQGVTRVRIPAPPFCRQAQGKIQIEEALVQRRRLQAG